MKQRWSPYDLPHLLEKSAQGYQQAVETIDKYPGGAAKLVENLIGTSVDNGNDNPLLRLTQIMARDSLEWTDVPLTWFDAGTSELVEQTHKTIPAWTPRAAIPADSGLIAFEKTPLTVNWQENGYQKMDVQIDAIFWKRDGNNVKISSLSRANPEIGVGTPLPNDIPLAQFTDLVIPLDTDVKRGQPIRYYLEHSKRLAEVDEKEPNISLDIIGACWLLMTQPRVIEEKETATTHVKRRERSQTQSKKREVKISVRGLVTHEATSSNQSRGKGTKAQTRWWVRGHWRQQAWGKKWSQRKPVFIQPHTAGNPDADLDNRPNVQIMRDNRTDGK